jgi:N-acetylneuraminate synthase
MATVSIGNRPVGDGEPCFIIAEIGINHNGDLAIAKRLINAAAVAGCDAVKFQKRTPELCVPPEQRALMRETPWGVMSYLDYRYHVEFGQAEYAQIDEWCRAHGVLWFASCWDEPSVDFMEQFSPVCYKVPSACLTDDDLLRKLRRTGRTVILSTGMSTMEEVRHAVAQLDRGKLLIAQSTSAYPCPPDDLNLRVIHTLREEFGCPIGYSGHETGLQTTYAAVSLGASFVERHITLDRAMWGTDQAASVESGGLIRLVRDIRTIERAMGDGVKRLYASELSARQKLRRVMTA